MDKLWGSITSLIDENSIDLSNSSFDILDVINNEYFDSFSMPCIFPKNTAFFDYVDVFGKNSKMIRLDILLALFFVSEVLLLDIFYIFLERFHQQGYIRSSRRCSFFKEMWTKILYKSSSHSPYI